MDVESRVGLEVVVCAACTVDYYFYVGCYVAEAGFCSDVINFGLVQVRISSRDVEGCFADYGQGYNFSDVEVLTPLLVPLKSFDWSTKTSPLSALGGMKGASKAHDLLLEAFSHEIEAIDDKQTLQGLLTAK